MKCELNIDMGPDSLVLTVALSQHFLGMAEENYAKRYLG
jgi:hypothetical protein